MRTFFSVLILALLGFALPASAVADPTPGPDPSRIVLNPAVDGSTSQFVTWRTDAATTNGSVEYRPVAGGATISVAASVTDPIDFTGWTYSSRHHKATLTGLTPATRYEYRVGTGGHWSQWHSFETATTDGSPWEMIYFGDAQTQLDTHWGPVVDKAFAKSPNAKLALQVGDMINNPDEDDQWHDWFNGIGSHASTVNQLVVEGNHERLGDLNLKQFRGHYTTPANGPHSSSYYVDYQDVRFIVLRGVFPLPGTEDPQPAFLEEALKTNPRKWSIVSVHEPLFAGAKGRDHDYLRDPLLPIIRKYNVDLVLQGHDHVYARGMLNEDIDPKTGFASGPVFAVSIAGPKYYELDPGTSNNWTDNGATRVIAHDQTSTYQPISFDDNVLTYRSYIASKGSASTTDKEVGDLLDAFTITRRKDGSKVVSEGETPPKLTDPQPPKVKPTLKIRKVLRNRNNGTARVTLVANVAGNLKARGKGIRPVNRKLKAKKRITVQIRTRPGKTRALRRQGRFAVKVKFSFRAKDGQTRNANRRIVLLRKKR